MRETVGPDMGVKAAGGRVHMQMLSFCGSRCYSNGTSAGVAILKEKMATTGLIELAIGNPANKPMYLILTFPIGAV